MRNSKTDLAELPKGWMWTKVGEICLKPQYGWTTSAIERGKIHLLRTTDITSGNIDWSTVPFCKKEPPEIEKYLLKDGDIVISRAGSIGYGHLVKNPQKAVFASYLIRFKPLIDRQYLAFFLKSSSYWEAISEKSLGIAIPNVNATRLRQISLPLPPFLEQHRIVAKIEELFTKLDAGVEALKRVKAQLKRHRQAVLKVAMEGKLTEEWRRTHKDELEPASVLLERIKEERKKKAKAEYKELPVLDAKNLSELSEGWVWTRVRDIGDVVTGTTPTKTKQKYYGSDYPFFKPTDLNAGYYVRHSRDGLSKEGLKHARLLPEKSILVTCIGATIGKTGFIRVAGASNQQINALIPEFEFLLPEFIYFLFTSPQVNKSIIDNSSSTTLPILNKSRFERLFIPLPPLSEQQEIVEGIQRRLSVTDETEKAVEHSFKQAEKLRQSILKKAFEGKLAPQDPTDEPASVLLEKMKKEELGAKTEKRPQKINKRMVFRQQRLF